MKETPNYHIGKPTNEQELLRMIYLAIIDTQTNSIVLKEMMTALISANSSKSVDTVRADIDQRVAEVHSEILTIQAQHLLNNLGIENP